MPDDVIVLGYDNIPQAAWHGYDLTSFDQRTDQMVTVAMDLLNEALQTVDHPFPKPAPLTRS